MRLFIRVSRSLLHVELCPHRLVVLIPRTFGRDVPLLLRNSNEMLGVKKIRAIDATVLVMDSCVEVRLPQPVGWDLAVIETADIHLFDFCKRWRVVK